MVVATVGSQLYNERETELFWTAARGLAHARKTGDNDAVAACRDELGVIALHTNQSKLAERAHNILSVDHGMHTPIKIPGKTAHEIVEPASMPRAWKQNGV